MLACRYNWEAVTIKGNFPVKKAFIGVTLSQIQSTTTTGFIRKFEQIFPGLFQDIFSTIYEFFQDFSQLHKMKWR